MWLRAHARLSRFEEEVNILEAEMSRTKAALRFEENRWLVRAGDNEVPGAQAWAMRQAALWAALLEHATKEFKDARSTYRPPLPTQ